VVAIAWVGHRDLFALIRRTDRTLVWLNILYMLPLCILPFGASLLARYDRQPVALRLYGAILVLVAVTRILIWIYATNRPHLLYTKVDRRSRALAVVLAAAPALAYLVAVLIAEAAPTASLAIYALVPIAYFVGITVERWLAPAGSADRNFT